MIWKIIGTVKAFMDKCKRDKINAYSAQTAFFIILSIIPFLMVFSSLLRYTSITEGMILEIIKRVMPDYVAPFIIGLVDEVYSRSMGLISVTAVIAIWSAAKGVQYMTDGLNAVNDLEETRNWFILRFWAIIYTIVFLVAIVFTLVILVFGNSLKKLATRYVPFLEHAVELFSNFRGLILIALLILFFAVIFTALPNRKLSFKSQLPGAVICAVAWYIFSFGLSVYVDYFNGMSMYGSLTTIALIMLWLYFCMYIMMMSAEVNVVFNDNFNRWLKRRQQKKCSAKAAKEDAK
jgi:membrane protein